MKQKRLLWKHCEESVAQLRDDGDDKGEADPNESIAADNFMEAVDEDSQLDLD